MMMKIKLIGLLRQKAGAEEVELESGTPRLSVVEVLTLLQDSLPDADLNLISGDRVSGRYPVDGRRRVRDRRLDAGTRRPPHATVDPGRTIDNHTFSGPEVPAAHNSK